MRSESTPVRRLKQCRIWYRPSGMPTLIAYPPPPPERRPSWSELAPLRLPAPTPRMDSPTLRPRSSRRRRDCVFIPEMDIAMQFVEARRMAARIERAEHEERPSRDALPVSAMESPLFMGLLMTLLPPLAVTLVWYSPRVPRAAQIALTAYGALVTLALTAVVIAAIG